MIEILTLKLCIDLFDHLKTYKMTASTIQIGFWKKQSGKYQYFTFDSYDDLWNFYYNRYYPFDLCEKFGDFWFVNKFTVSTELDNSYTMSFSAFDVNSENSVVNVASEYDNARNNVWLISKERQESFIKSVIDEYRTYYNELYEIYLHGIYSVCYAEPGWTTHTTRLKSYKDLLFNNNDNKNKYSGFVLDEN